MGMERAERLKTQKRGWTLVCQHCPQLAGIPEKQL